MGVEVDDAVLAARGLGTTERDAAVVAAALVAGSGEAADEQDDLLADVEAAPLQVDVSPAQTDRLTASESRGGEQVEGRTELVAVGVVEEPAELLRFPRPHVRPLHRRQRDADSGVVRDESEPHGRAQRGAQRGVHAAQAGRFHASGRSGSTEGGFDVLRSQFAQSEVSDAGDEVVVEVGGVAGGGGGPESVGDSAGQPVGEEGATVTLFTATARPRALASSTSARAFSASFLVGNPKRVTCRRSTCMPSGPRPGPRSTV